MNDEQKQERERQRKYVLDFFKQMPLEELQGIKKQVETLIEDEKTKLNKRDLFTISEILKGNEDAPDFEIIFPEEDGYEAGTYGWHEIVRHSELEDDPDEDESLEWRREANKLNYWLVCNGATYGTTVKIDFI